ncbi:hypothetical protein [Labrys neptuniae]|uniref:Entry exclusion lipoprotein TrbK n=1 Tax=Labrys neptuniae TaxID=376174 RepID=A0ABV3PRV0_9HYPH
MRILAIVIPVASLALLSGCAPSQEQIKAACEKDAGTKGADAVKVCIDRTNFELARQWWKFNRP